MVKNRFATLEQSTVPQRLESEIVFGVEKIAFCIWKGWKFQTGFVLATCDLLITIQKQESVLTGLDEGFRLDNGLIAQEYQTTKQLSTVAFHFFYSELAGQI